MSRFRLNRKQKIVRNLLACGLLGLAVYAMLGFPPYTVRGMLDRAERRYLLSDLEPLLVERSSRKYSDQFYKNHDTYLLAKSGDTYVYTMYTRSLLRVCPEYGRNLKMGSGALCTARDGTMYVAGPFQTAASATAEVTAQKTTQYYTQSTDTWETVLGESCTFTFQGERLGEELFSFRYRAEDHHASWALDGVPESEYDLENAAEEWYSSYWMDSPETGGGRGLLHADLPVHVTLYDEAGNLLNTLDLTVDTYELHFRY